MPCESLIFKKVGKSFGDKIVLNNIDLEIPQGQFSALVGPSGCGKTTLLRIAAGLEEATSGKVFSGTTLFSDAEAGYSMPPEKRHLGMLFQSYAIWPHMTIFENVAFPLKMQKFKSAEIQKKVFDTLAKVGLQDFDKRYPHTLSGGQQQRVALARALVQEPALLFLDEPLSNLDASLRNQMRQEIKNLQKSLGFTAVIVTHDWTDAKQMCDLVVLLKDGRIEQMGTVAEIENNPSSNFVKELIA